MADRYGNKQLRGFLGEYEKEMHLAVESSLVVYKKNWRGKLGALSYALFYWYYRVRYYCFMDSDMGLEPNFNALNRIYGWDDDCF